MSQVTKERKLMIYALNVYDIIPGKESVYASYIEEISRLFKNFDMRIAAAGGNSLPEISG